MGTMTVSGSSSGLASGQKVIGPVTYAGTTAAIGGITDANLSVGDNSFSVPSGATFVAIFLGSGPAPTVKLRTNLNSGDAGLPIAPYSGTGWAGFPLPTGVTTIILNSSTTLTGIELSYV